MKELPPLERLNDLFVCDPDTGQLYKKVGHKNHEGYVYVYVDGKQYFAHRIIWKLETGREPEGVIDHINGETSDNRIENLRDVTHTENMRNRRSRKKERLQQSLEFVERWKERLARR
jgi:hypothetical protein